MSIFVWSFAQSTDEGLAELFTPSSSPPSPAIVLAGSLRPLCASTWVGKRGLDSTSTEPAPKRPRMGSKGSGKGKKKVKTQDEALGDF